MIRILIFLALVSVLAAGATWLADRPGEVVVVWQGLRIETSVAMAAIGVAVLVLLGMLAWGLARFFLGLPQAFSFASRARRKARGFEAVTRGMLAVGSGDPAAARRYASDARKLIADEPLTLLLTAQSAQLSADKPAAEEAFKAMLEDPETRVLGLRGLFVEARRRGDAVAARAFADEAVRLAPSLSWANDALLEFHTAAGDWAQARTAVERRTALRLTDKTEARRNRAVLLAAEALDKQEEDPQGALAAALEAVKLAPGLTPAAALAGRLLVQRGDLRKAARILEAAWREQPHPDLATAYLNLRSGDAVGDRLAKAKALRDLKPSDPESALTVAKAAIAARDFATAREALQPLVAAVPTVRTCLLMAAVEDGEFGAQGRAREWLAKAARAPRDPAWIADGVVSDHWAPVSPVSGRLDAYVWAVPPAAISQGVDEAALLLEQGPAPAEPAAAPEPAAPAEILLPPARSEAPPPAPPVMAEPPTMPAVETVVAIPPEEPAKAVPEPAPEPAPEPPAPPPPPEAIFPARPPDDPGPEAEPEAEAPKRRFGLFG